MAVGGPADEFELMRRRVKQESQAAGQKRQQELKRQFARTGGLQSGAFIKQSGIEAQEQQQAQQRAVEGVDIAEAGVRRQELEAEKQRTFASGEAQKQRTFQSLQAQLGREFSASERLAAQDFSSMEAGIQRDFQEKLAKQGRDFQKELATDAEALQREIMDFEQAETKKVNAVNAMNSLINTGFSKTQIDDIFSQLGLEDLVLAPPGSQAAQDENLPDWLKGKRIGS
jgi:hypothetical protein